MKLTNKDCSCEEQQGSVSITDDLIEDVNEIIRDICEMPEPDESDSIVTVDLKWLKGKLVESLQRQRERQEFSSELKTSAVPEIDYEDLIKQANKFGYAQGTKNCIAFKNGAEYFKSVFLTVSTAPSPELISPQAVGEELTKE